MKKLIALTLLFCLAVMAQAADSKYRIYWGNSTSYSDIEFTIKGDHIYRGNSTSYSDIAYTIKGDHIYRGDSTSYSDIRYTIKEIY